MGVLLVEDDAPLAAMIAGFLGKSGFEVAIEGNGARAVARIVTEAPALVILDVTLPGKDGFAVCREARRSYLGPILMLTARNTEADEVLGLDVGADDYIAKPVRPQALLARVRASLRRRGETPAVQTRYTVRDLVLDVGQRTATLRGVPIELTSGELDLLAYLATHPGEPRSRAAIYRELRGATHDDADRAIDLMVSRLRHKLAAPFGDSDLIKTIRGVGYLLTTRGDPHG